MFMILLAIVLAVVAVVLTLFSLSVFISWQVSRRQAFIKQYALPENLAAKLMRLHPNLTQERYELVAAGLRQYFMVQVESGGRHIAMPSKVADDLWHEFILHTRQYHEFCRKAFGHYLHHTPAPPKDEKTRRSNEGLLRCWDQACRLEYIDPRAPVCLPLLFALDCKLQIANGFHYPVKGLYAPRQNESWSDGIGIDCEALIRGLDNGGTQGGGADGCGGDGGGGDSGGGGGGSGCGSGCSS